MQIHKIIDIRESGYKRFDKEPKILENALDSLSMNGWIVIGTFADWFLLLAKEIEPEDLRKGKF
jgi:hypothetical protein